MRYLRRPSLDDLLRDSEMDMALRKGWQESSPYAREVLRGQPGSLKREQGGFIYWNKISGMLEIQRLPHGSRESLGGVPSPDTRERELIASFHTHPNTVAEGYAADPSPADRAFVRNISQVPEIIETHEGRKTIPYP